MADKKLDDLMKDLQSYTVQVAQEKKKAQFEASRHKFIFPWKYLFLAVAVCIWYFWKPILVFKATIAKQPQVIRMLEALDQSDPAVETVKVSAVKARQDALNGVEIPTLGTSPTNLDADRKVASKSDVVQIEGRWYKKSADNIYYINGRRVFFLDKRNREEPPK